MKSLDRPWLLGLWLQFGCFSAALAAGINDNRVNQWIAVSLAKDSSVLDTNIETFVAEAHSVDRVRSGWERLKRCRDAGNSLDLELAAAEHYLFMRFSAGKSGDTGYRRLPKWYETFKSAAVRSDWEHMIQTSDQPVSPPNENVTRWGNQGVERGLLDYQLREGRAPGVGTSSISVLAGTSYAVYYYNPNGYRTVSTGHCDITMPPYGIWESMDAGRRWLLQFSGNKCIWIERSALGSTLKREVPVQSLPGSQVHRISRDNDNEVLAFLGFSPGIRAAVAARSPQPSFMTITFGGSTLSAEWNGILVIKDDQAKFKELKQPGQSTSKRFEFVMK